MGVKKVHFQKVPTSDTFCLHVPYWGLRPETHRTSGVEGEGPPKTKYL